MKKKNGLKLSYPRKNNNDCQDWDNVCKSLNLILLTDLPKGTNYKQHLKILKTEGLLNGTRIHK